MNGLIAGLSVDEICRVTGLSSATVAREKRKIVEAKTAERETAVTELREIELARLDRLQRGHFAAACDGNVHSAKVVLQCIAQRSKMLGLDAPVKVDVQERTQLDAQIEQLLTELEGVGVKVKQ